MFMFIAALFILFTLAKKWNQLRCSSTDEWIEQICFMCTMEFYA